MPTCSGMRLATPWRLVESIRGPCRPSWAIARSPTPLSTPRWPTSGSETSGASEIGGWRLSDERHRAPLLGWPGPRLIVIAARLLLVLVSVILIFVLLR